MPIEIKELHIKITVDESVKNKKSTDEEVSEKEQLIEACVEKVMEIINQKKER